MGSDAVIPIAKPFFGEEEMRAVQRPLETGWVVQGPFVRKFEEAFAEYTGSRNAVATSSCTTALHVAVSIWGLEPGDEVVVPAFTWITTANVVEYQRATPVFCDIDIRTFNVNPGEAEALVTPKTVGIIPAHLFGLCADMESLQGLAEERSLWMVEDAACAFGAQYQGRHAGTFGDVGCFSFHPRKAITTGEGGMLVTERQDFDRLARSLRDHGASRSDFDRHRASDASTAQFDHLGYNYRMTDIQGALGCAQLARADWILSARARAARLYDEMLEDMDWVQTPVVADGYTHGYQAYVCMLGPDDRSPAELTRLHKKRNDVMAQLYTRGIATRQGTHAPVLQGYYADKYGLRPERFPNAVAADKLSLALPLFPQITSAEQERVVTELKHVYEGL